MAGALGPVLAYLFMSGSPREPEVDEVSYSAFKALVRDDPDAVREVELDVDALTGTLPVPAPDGAETVRAVAPPRAGSTDT